MLAYQKQSCETYNDRETPIKGRKNKPSIKQIAGKFTQDIPSLHDRFWFCSNEEKEHGRATLVVVPNSNLLRERLSNQFLCPHLTGRGYPWPPNCFRFPS